MLKQRVLTALILIPLVIAGVLWLPTSILSLILALLVLAGGWEWAVLCGFQGKAAKFMFLSALAAVLLLIHFTLLHDFGVRAAMGLALAVWVLAMLWMANPAYRANKAVKAVLGLIVLASTWMALVWMHSFGPEGPALVLYLMVLIWIADSGAYFSGKRFGRVKLAPNISPGKTREGAYGAIAAVIIYSLVMGMIMDISSLILFIGLSLVVAVISIIGDLFESLLKRQAGLKDSGAVLPGHGGVLDRVDSLLAAAPVFLAGLLAWPVV